MQAAAPGAPGAALLLIHRFGSREGSDHGDEIQAQCGIDALGRRAVREPRAAACRITTLDSLEAHPCAFRV